jgi:hypothetical protein
MWPRHIAGVCGDEIKRIKRINNINITSFVW